MNGRLNNSDSTKKAIKCFKKRISITIDKNNAYFFLQIIFYLETNK